MLPLRDKNPSGVVPWAVYGVIAANVAVFAVEMSLPGEALQAFLTVHGFVPARATAALQGKAGLVAGLLAPMVTSMFLHGGFAHVLGNMWFLHVFGDNVEGRLGHVRFLAFYFVCGLSAGALQYVLDPGSTVPMIGASGAIAGTLGAYLICWPGARIVTLVPLFLFFTFLDLPAVFVLGMWFLVQLLQGTAGLGVEFAHGGVAYWAHVGGFVAGMVLVKLWPDRSQRRWRRSL